MSKQNEESLPIMSEALCVGSPDYWTRLYHQAVIMNRAGLLVDPEYAGTHEEADTLSVDVALTTIARLKGETE